MSYRYMFDTDTASYLIRKRSPSIEAQMMSRLDDEACISIVTRAEILFGLKKVPPESALHQRAAYFFENHDSLSWDVRAAERYADIRFSLERHGSLIGAHDTMIAAHAMSIGAILVTNNVRHFERIGADLMIENWHQD